MKAKEKIRKRTAAQLARLSRGGRRIKALSLTHEQKVDIIDKVESGFGPYRVIGDLYGVSGSRVGKIYSDRKEILSTPLD